MLLQYAGDTKLHVHTKLFYWYCGLKPDLHGQNIVDSLGALISTWIDASGTSHIFCLFHSQDCYLDCPDTAVLCEHPLFLEQK